MANEKRLIPEGERTNLIRCLKKMHDCDFTPGVYEHSVIGRAALFLEETADAVQVVHGRWIPLEYDGYADGNPVWDLWECSECQEEHNGDEDTLTPFCPNCGAKMDGDGDG